MKKQKLTKDKNMLQLYFASIKTDIIYYLAYYVLWIQTNIVFLYM